MTNLQRQFTIDVLGVCDSFTGPAVVLEPEALPQLEQHRPELELEAAVRFEMVPMVRPWPWQSALCWAAPAGSQLESVRHARPSSL